MLPALLAATLVVAAVFLLVRGLERQVGGLADRVDRLQAQQGDVPRQVAEEGAIQARSLAEVRERLAGLEAAARQLEALGTAVDDIRQIVTVPRLRGAMGELWLEELLADVLPAGHWERQYGFRSGERVDAVVRVGDRVIPVDAKFPLEACRRMLAATGADAERERRGFARSLKERVDEIADRYIRPDEGTFPFALMYVPAEGIYWEAVRLDDDVLGYARGRNVVLVSPHTFFAYLQAIAHGLRGLAVEARARELLDGLTALRQAADRFAQTIDRTRRHLQHAGRQVDELARAGGEIGERLARFTDG